MRDSVVKSGIDPCPGIPGFTLYLSHYRLAMSIVLVAYIKPQQILKKKKILVPV